MQIGDKLACGEPHDGRAPDYDDWALNADIVVYYPVLDIALELSSVAVFSGNNFFPIPLVYENRMDIVGVFIPADGVHIRI